MATLYDAVKQLRVYILNDIGGTGNNWELVDEGTNGVASKLLWSNEELTKYIDEAQIEVARRCNLFEDFGTDFNITLTAGNSIYDLHPKITHVIGNILQSNGQQLEHIDMKQIFEETRWDQDTGTPRKFAMNYRSKQVYFFPTPVVADTWKPFVYRLPLNTLNWSSSTSDLEVPDEYAFKMLWYAAALAYLKNDVDTYDPKESKKFMDLFDGEFETTSAYSDTRKRRTSNRGVKYGGISFSPIHNSTLLTILRNSNS